jgi:hypothetical protein
MRDILKSNVALFTLERKATGVFLLQALPFPNTQCNNFEAYWKSVGLDLEEGIALLGSHCVADTTNKYAICIQSFGTCVPGRIFRAWSCACSACSNC